MEKKIDNVVFKFKDPYSKEEKEVYFSDLNIEEMETALDSLTREELIELCINFGQIIQDIEENATFIDEEDEEINYSLLN